MFWAGDMWAYIDSNENAHQCHFCQTTMGNCIDESTVNTIEKIQNKRCPANQESQVGIHDT